MPVIGHLDDLVVTTLSWTLSLCRCGIARVFPRSTPEEEKRFDLLKRAYVEARVLELKGVAEESCRRKIESLGRT